MSPKPSRRIGASLALVAALASASFGDQCEDGYWGCQGFIDGRADKQAFP